MTVEYKNWYLGHFHDDEEIFISFEKTPLPGCRPETEKCGIGQRKKYPKMNEAIPDG